MIKLQTERDGQDINMGVTRNAHKILFGKSEEILKPEINKCTCGIILKLVLLYVIV